MITKNKIHCIGSETLNPAIPHSFSLQWLQGLYLNVTALLPVRSLYFSNLTFYFLRAGSARSSGLENDSPPSRMQLLQHPEEGIQKKQDIKEMWGPRPTQDFLRGPDDETKATSVLCHCPGTDLARPGQSETGARASKESRLQILKTQLFPGTVIIRPEASVSEMFSLC